MKIAICDDVIEEQNELQTFCQQLGYCDISLCGEDFLNAPDSSQFHLLFLDIEMKGLTGIELKALLEKTNPSIFIVFTTTHEEMMPEAFGRNVISFLTKPLDLNSIKHCLTKAAYLQMDFFPIAINDCVFIPCQDILYGESYISRDSLTAWNEKLKEFGFCPVSRNSIINLKYYKKTYQKQAILSTEIRLLISRRYLQTLDETFRCYMIKRV